MKTKETKLGFYIPDGTESTQWITKDVASESEMDEKTTQCKRETRAPAETPFGGTSEDQIEDKVYMIRYPSPYPWTIEHKEYSTPRPVGLKDIFKMCVSKVFDYTPANMRTLDTRLTRKKFMATLEAAEIFDPEHSRRPPTPLPKKAGRNPKRVYKGRVAKHKAKKFAGPDLSENIGKYIEREFDIANKQAVRLSTPQVFQTECYKLIQKCFSATIESIKLESTFSAVKVAVIKKVLM